MEYASHTFPETEMAAIKNAISQKIKNEKMVCKGKIMNELDKCSLNDTSWIEIFSQLYTFEKCG